MGLNCSKHSNEDIEAAGMELEELRSCLTLLLKTLSPDELLSFASVDKEIYEICKNQPDLRLTCILAAVRRYHTEKFLYEEVYNRTARFVEILDNFIQIQDEEDTMHFEEESTDMEQPPTPKGCSFFRKFYRRHDGGNRRGAEEDDDTSTDSSSNSTSTV